jgi:predicted nucleic-acid-binding protein
MALVDANIVLRYILRDNKELARNAKVIIENKEIEIPFEVIAEIVYVLEKVYSVERNEIYQSILLVCEYSNVIVTDYTVLEYALKEYKDANIDFVDALLLGYNSIRKKEVHTFDKKLNKLLKN